MKIKYIGTNNVTYVFNNSSKPPQRLIEFVTIYTYPRMALGHFRLQIWWFEADLWEKVGIFNGKTAGRKCVFDNRLFKILDR